MTNEDIHKLIDSATDKAILDIHKTERDRIRGAIWEAVVTVLNKSKEERKSK